jgi:hypothetical protein
MSRTPAVPIEALDPSRLRIPFMGKRARRTLPEEELQLTKSLDLSNSLSNNPNLFSNNLSKLSNLNERLNLPKSLEVLVESFQETQDPPAKSHTTLDAWVFVLTYAIFGIALALCNLFNVSGRLCCVGLSPLPMLCLLLHAASSASLPISLALLLCALSLPPSAPSGRCRSLRPTSPPRHAPSSPSTTAPSRSPAASAPSCPCSSPSWPIRGGASASLFSSYSWHACSPLRRSM